MGYWLKLVGTVDWPVPEHWVMERSDLLKEVRFGERHPPTPIKLSDHLIYHAVGERRLIAVVAVQSTRARYDASTEWERQWPLVIDVRPILRVGRVSQGPATSVLRLTQDFAHQSFLPVHDSQYLVAVNALRSAGAH